ncbi:MAG: hypothetical protein NVSMB19_09520 [Vulcanimicrobiaceae bacterium]
MQRSDGCRERPDGVAVDETESCAARVKKARKSHNTRGFGAEKARIPCGMRVAILGTIGGDGRRLGATARESATSRP